jgi:hypothetical protein
MARKGDLPQEILDQPIGAECHACQGRIEATIGQRLHADTVPLLCPQCGAAYDPERAAARLREEVAPVVAGRRKLLNSLKKPET